MLSSIEKFKLRKRVSQVVEVKFLPNTIYARYAQKVLKREKSLEEFDEQEKAEAELMFHELTISFKRMAPMESRGWDLKMMEGNSASLIEFIVDKLGDSFHSAKHHPKDGSEPIEFTKDTFREFLGYLLVTEVFDLAAAYRRALRDDEELAAGNGHISDEAGGTP